MSVVMEIRVLFLSKRLNGPKKPAHLGKHHWIVYEGGFWSVFSQMMSRQLMSGAMPRLEYTVFLVYIPQVFPLL